MKFKKIDEISVILTILMINKVFTDNSPVVVIYTFGVYRDLSGKNSNSDRPAEHWMILLGRDYDMDQLKLSNYAERMASIPLSTTVNRSQLFFWGEFINQNTIIFKSNNDRYNTAQAFLILPDIVMRERKFEVRLFFTGDEL
jgi:hypothetical protein